MKLPSVDQILRDAAQTFRRFPETLICAAVATAAALILIDVEGAVEHDWLYTILLAAIIGFPLLFALTLTAERAHAQTRSSLSAIAAGVVLLAVYAATLPTHLPVAPQVHMTRFGTLLLSAYFLATVLPFIGRGETNGFWQFNKTLHLRILLTGLFSGVLYGGLAIALGALDNLFGVDVTGKRYGELGVLILGLFSTWFLLAGIPHDLGALENETSHPRLLRIFAQYIVLPIALVYLIILYAYMAKVIIDWDWPRGWVTGLVIGFAITGTVTLLLLHPLRQAGANAWIRNAARWYHILMAPLVVMLVLAVIYRVNAYGITESRYYALAVGAWCIVMIILSFIPRAAGITSIPIVLFVMTLATSMGPWSAFSISRASQEVRLSSLLAHSGILVDGHIRKPGAAVSETDARDISSIIQYLYEMHDYDAIQPWFAESLAQNPTRFRAVKSPKDVTTLMGVTYVEYWVPAREDGYSFRAVRDQAVDLGGYDRMIRSQRLGADSPARDIVGTDISVRPGGDLRWLVLARSANGRSYDSVRIDLRAIAHRLERQYAHRNTGAIPPDSLSVAATGRTFSARILIWTLDVTRRDGQLMPNFVDADIFYRLTP